MNVLQNCLFLLSSSTSKNNFQKSRRTNLLVTLSKFSLIIKIEKCFLETLINLLRAISIRIVTFIGGKILKNSLRFGVFTAQNASIEKIIQQWKFCEEAGIDSIWVADHFAHRNKGLDPFWESWALLTAITCNTKKIRFGTLVTCMV